MANIFKIIVSAFLAVFLLIAGCGTIHKVDDTEWQAVQYLNGKVEIKESAGLYFALFPKITEYPRNFQITFTEKPSEESAGGKAIRTTFNDGGNADIDTLLRISTPTSAEQKREFHRQFNGNLDNVKSAVYAHLSNVLKASGPLMSASENQASRKSEFGVVVENQLNDGLYDMRRVERELDQVDETGKKIRVAATEVIRDVKNAKPVVSQESPLAEVGIKVTQFSITRTDYDQQTLKQFEQKKDASLRAESAKAQRENEVQQRLMIEEKGRREKAETEAKANQEKAQAVITAQKEKEVAELQGAQRLAVSRLQKDQAETKAAEQVAVAKLGREAAEEDGKKMIILAQSEKDRIALAGAITEKERVTLQFDMDTKIGVASQLAKVNVPQFIISGGNGAQGGAGDIQSQLIQLRLLDSAGVLNLAPKTR